MTRPPREDYIRVTVEADRFTLEPAVEWRDGDGFYEMTAALEGCARDSAASLAEDPMSRARATGALIARRWPDRAWFVEVWHGEGRGFAQCVQPYGFPRNAPGLESYTPTPFGPGYTCTGCGRSGGPTPDPFRAALRVRLGAPADADDEALLDRAMDLADDLASARLQIAEAERVIAFLRGGAPLPTPTPETP